jgi:CheY-like chemotaxis protein
MARILIIEDDPAILRGLADNLACESHDVLTAADGERGYSLARTEQPDLIVLDLMLPRMSGYDLCRRLRAEGAMTPIVMLTARGEEADRVVGSISAPTTTSPSRSRCASCSRASGRSSGGCRCRARSPRSSGSGT